MIKIGIIGAGTISSCHIEAYKNNMDCKVTAIADLNISLAQQRADEYGIEKVFEDYKELLKDKEIDAVSIVTPTFTHTNIVIDALKSGKNVLCEKPPALTAEEVRKCACIAKEAGKLLMYAFVRRFEANVQYLKNYIDSGKMGQFVYAEAARIARCLNFNGWLCDKKKSGGFLFDGGIHELDLLLYLMGYPKPKAILGFTSNINSDLPGKIKNNASQYNTMDNSSYDRTIESFANGTVILDNGASILIKSGSVLNSVFTGKYIDICGENAGARIGKNKDREELEILELDENGCANKEIPSIDENDAFEAEINHFVDCCLNSTECICKPDEAITLIEIINGIYKSAEMGKSIEF